VKDPAFLFYSDNFLSGTMFFNDEQLGKYIRLLCAQHLTGHMHEKDMLKICKTKDEEIWAKFVKDAEGKYYNTRLEAEMVKRKLYSESRARNRKGKVKEVKQLAPPEPEEEKKLKYKPRVLLKKTEYEKLCADFGINTAIAAIEFLDLYKQEKKYITKSDYLSIRRWVIDAVNKTKKHDNKQPIDYLVATDGTKIYEKDIDFSQLGK